MGNSKQKNYAETALRSDLNPHLIAGSGMPQSEMERSNLWDTSDDKIWGGNKVHVRLTSDALLEDEEELAKMSGEVITYYEKVEKEEDS